MSWTLRAPPTELTISQAAAKSFHATAVPRCEPLQCRSPARRLCRAASRRRDERPCVCRVPVALLAVALQSIGATVARNKRHVDLSPEANFNSKYMCSCFLLIARIQEGLEGIARVFPRVWEELGELGGIYESLGGVVRALRTWEI